MIHPEATQRFVPNPAHRRWILAVCLSSGCFYSDPIRERPRAEIAVMQPQATYYPGSVLSLSAEKSSADASVLRCDWQAYECEETCTLLSEAKGLSPFATFQLTVPGHRRLEIQLQVEDERGVKDRATHTVLVGNRAPTARAQVQMNGRVVDAVPVGAIVEIVAEADDEDGDVATLEWQLTRPSDSVLANVEWQAIDANRFRLKPDVPGVFTVGLAAKDALGATESIEVPIVVLPDAPPCLSRSAPPYDGGVYVMARDGGARRFSATLVKDDLDGFPSADAPGSLNRANPQFRFFRNDSSTGFVWSEIAGWQGGVMFDPISARAGEKAKIRIEVRDRVVRGNSCPIDADTCSADGNSCVQRATWEIEVR